MATLRPALAKKKEEADKVGKLISEHKTLILISAERVRTSLLNEMRDVLRGRVTFRHTKPAVLKRAITAMGDRSMDELAEKYVTGPIIMALSNEDPFKLTHEFRNRGVRLQAKAGDIVTGDIVVEPGNTGLPPGPVISELNEAGIPTRIETGSVWVTKRTTVAEAGDKISTRLGSALSKLGMKPIMSYLKPKCAWHDGTLFEGSILETTLEEIASQIRSSWAAAISVAVDAKLFIRESLPMLLGQATVRARALAVSTSFITPDSVIPLMAQAKARAAGLESIVPKK